MASRPVVSVYNTQKQKLNVPVLMPAVFVSPIRPDLVQFVHTNMNKNHRQAYAVSSKAGHQCAAASWGTGRAVARIPRVHGSGTHRAGQGAFGNMCRGGRMFAPTQTWRRWHRKINVNQRRYAVASALAASAVPALVMARGHHVEKVPEVPLVISDDVEKTSKTQKAIEILKAIGAYDDVEKVKRSRALRRGQGKARNRRYVQRRGPLVIYNNDKGLVKALRNVPGVDVCCVTRLNLLQLAPGGHLGRFCVWTKSALNRLDSLYGTQRRRAIEKKGYHLPRPIMSQPDLNRIINSDEVQSVLRPTKINIKYSRKKNPLKNLGVMNKLNPYVKVLRRHQALARLAAAAAKKGGDATKGKTAKGKTAAPAPAVKRSRRATLTKEQKATIRASKAAFRRQFAE